MCHSHRRNACNRGYAPVAAYGPYGATADFVCTNCQDGYVCRECRHRRRHGYGYDGCGQGCAGYRCGGCRHRRHHGHGGPIGLIISLVVMGVKGVQSHREKKRLAREVEPASDKGNQVDTRSAPQIANQAWDSETSDSSQTQMREVTQYSREKKLKKRAAREEEQLPSYDSAVKA